MNWPSNRAAVFAGTLAALLTEFGPAGYPAFDLMAGLIAFLLMIFSTVEFSYLRDLSSRGMSLSQLPFRFYEGFTYLIGPIRKRVGIYVASFVLSYLFLSITHDLIA